MRYALLKPRFSIFIVSFVFSHGTIVHNNILWYYYSLLLHRTLRRAYTTLDRRVKRNQKTLVGKKALLFVSFFLQHRPVAGTSKAETAASLRLGKNHRSAPVPADVAVHAQQLRLSDIPGRLRARQRVAVRDQDLSISQFQRLYDSRSSLR